MAEPLTGTPGVGLFGCGEIVLLDLAFDSFVVSKAEFVVAVVAVEEGEAAGAGVGVGVGAAFAITNEISRRLNRCWTCALAPASNPKESRTSSPRRATRASVNPRPRNSF